MVKINKKWYEILEQNGNYALIKFGNSKICYNILGLETKEKYCQTKLF